MTPSPDDAGRLEEIRKRVEAARGDYIASTSRTKADALLLADIPHLLDRITAMTAENDRLRAPSAFDEGDALGAYHAALLKEAPALNREAANGLEQAADDGGMCSLCGGFSADVGHTPDCIVNHLRATADALEAERAKVRAQTLEEAASHLDAIANTTSAYARVGFWAAAASIRALTVTASPAQRHDGETE